MPDDPKKERPIGHSNTVVKDRRKSIPWIWEGVVAEEAVTLLSAPEKIGKTTLLSLLLDRRRAGGQLMGRSVYPGKTVLCSEENWTLWALRQPPLDFGPDLIFHNPDCDCPMRLGWERFIDDLCKLSFQEIPFDLLVMDTAMSFMPLGHRNKQLLRWVFEQVSLVASFPAGVLIINQSRNAHRPLAAFADIVIEMAIPRAAGRCRTFTGVGRYPDTLQTASAELNVEGTDYVLLPESTPPHAPLLPTLRDILAASPTPLTHQEIMSRWPGPAPHQGSLWRTLARGRETGVFTFSGSGSKIDCFRFGLRQTNPAGSAAG